MLEFENQEAQGTSDDFNIFVISDGTGKTAFSVVQAALLQFELPRVNVLRFTHVRSEEEIYNIMDMVRVGKDIVVYTVVNEDLARVLRAEAANRSVIALDILGPIVEALKRVSLRKPRGIPGILQREESVAEYLEAIEYAMEKSTGFSVSNLDQADVVLLTVWYPHRDECILRLAEKGVKCGYIMLDPSLPLPVNFEEVVGKGAKPLIVGIDMDPQYLSELRLERIRALGLHCLVEKASPERVEEELAFARSVYERLSCPVIDITRLSVHDVVGKIFEQIKKKREEQA
ncbi:MAG: kinase/pyrophosphorylase [Candidatus Caldatribacterium sp.]|nr:kinase/pyrophosphorylase [Candidatus Caldatribacterium sp.]